MIKLFLYLLELFFTIKVIKIIEHIYFHTFMKKLFFLFIFLLLSKIIFAQDSLFLLESQVSELMEIPINTENITISSASKIEQNIAEAPNLVSFINKKQITEYGFVSLNDILYRQAGVSYSQDFDRATVSLRGNFESWNNNHWLLLIDGIPFNENTSGSALTSEVTPLIFSKSVEMIRGAGSALYGTNAMNGVISLNSLSAADLHGKTESRMRIGNQGNRIYDAMLGTENNKMSMIIAFNHYQSNGNNYMTYDGSGRRNTDGSLKQFLTNDSRNSNYLFAKFNFKGKLRGLSFQYHDQHWEYGTNMGWAFNIPDQMEFLEDYKRVFVINYKTDPSKALTAEFAVRYQQRGFDWNLRLAVDSSQFNGILYPNGISEYLKSSLDDVFTRAQMSYRFNNSGVFLAGLENNFYYYGGDIGHQSNIDVNNTFLPNPNNQVLPAKSFWEYAEGLWTVNTGLFGQYVSPKLLNNKLSITAGLRFDFQDSDYKDIFSANKDIQKKSFSKLSPRLSMVYALNTNLYLKAMAGRAFRVPSYLEIFSANAFIAASNVKQLIPEIADTYELATDWQMTKNWNWKANIFYNYFQNLIAYSTQNNSLSTNMYTLSTVGAETELFWDNKKQGKNHWTGFFNYGIAKRLDEQILDSTVAKSDLITWVPSQTAKMGLTYKHQKFYISSILTYQGETLRRTSDLKSGGLYSKEIIEVQKYRPNSIPAWASLDLKFSYTPNKYLEFGILVNNLLDSKRFLAKNFSYPMDYQMPQRLIMLDIKINY